MIVWLFSVVELKQSHVTDLGFVSLDVSCRTAIKNWKVLGLHLIQLSAVI